MMYFNPTWIVDNVSHIDPIALHQQGVKGLIFDLDNTLMPPSQPELWDWVAAWLSEMQALGFLMAVASNNPRASVIQKAQALLGKDFVVIGRANKPHPKAILEIAQAWQLPPHAVAMVGDRPTTDIWAGQRAGMKTILTRPLMGAKECTLYKVLRHIEWWSVKQ